MTRIHVAVAATALFATVTITGCSSREQPPTPKAPIPVKVRAVSSVADVALARYSGSLEPAVRVDMAFRVNGYLEMLGQVPGDGGKPRALEVGDFVQQGMILARIRSSDYSQKVATARAGMAEARSESKLADAELLRAQKLFDTKAITKAELDAKIAKAEYSHANVDAASARAGEAGVALEDTVLKAPMAGVILARDMEVGTLIAPGKTVISLADVRTVKASFGVPESLVEKLSVGSPLTVQIGGEVDSTRKSPDASVTRIAPSADSRGRVFAIEAELANPNGSLRPGSVVSVHVPEATLASAALSVPLSAIVRAPNDQRGFAVFVVEGDAARSKAHSQTVRLGEVLGNSVTVVAGLRSGERVVTVGSTLIQDGSDTVVIP